MEGAVERAQELCRENPHALHAAAVQQPGQRRRAPAHDRPARSSRSSATARRDAFVAGVGTGGTITGVGRGAARASARTCASSPSSRRRAPVLSGGPPGEHRIDGIGAGFVPADPGPLGAVRRCARSPRRDAQRDQAGAGPARGAAGRHLGGRLGEDRARRRARARPGQDASSPSCATPASATSRSTRTSSDAARRRREARAWSSARAGSAARPRSRWRRPASRRIGVVDDDLVDATQPAPPGPVHRPPTSATLKVERARARAARAVSRRVRVEPHARPLRRRQRRRAGARATTSSSTAPTTSRPSSWPTTRRAGAASRWCTAPRSGMGGPAPDGAGRRSALLPLPVRGAAAARASARRARRRASWARCPASSARCMAPRRRGCSRRSSRFRRAPAPV